MASLSRQWICAQLGSREHYAIPRVLHAERRLSLLLTDFWCRHPSLLGSLGVTGLKKLAERRLDELKDARVEDVGFGRLLFDLQTRRGGRTSWETTISRNKWFQERLLQRLRGKYLQELKRQPPGIFFCYSYAALELLRFFKELGWTTILGQIDPGIQEEHLVAAEKESHPELETSWQRAPREYWELWEEELKLADIIAVNSAWSRQALVATGVDKSRIHILPLAYQSDTSGAGRKTYPSSFSGQRPLRVLFLGQINLRKGIRVILDAAAALRDIPVEFWMVGPSEVTVPAEFRQSKRFRWTGAVSRSEADRFYEEADLFLLPTLSDGFALTQLEAQAKRLPLIASPYCGEVVRDGHNGILLDPLNGETLAASLKKLAANPSLLDRYSRASRVPDEFSLERLSGNLLELAEAAPGPGERSRPPAPIAGQATGRLRC